VRERERGWWWWRIEGRGESVWVCGKLAPRLYAIAWSKKSVKDNLGVTVSA